VPIDHGLCIPDNLAVCSYDLAWLSWRQAEKPFSQRTLKFIESIDIMEDIKLLENTFKFRPICLRNIRISSLLLQRGAMLGLNLAQIGQILCRPDEDDSQPSLLERIVDKARLIADMMWRIQSKIKDSNLRQIEDPKKVSNFQEEELKHQEGLFNTRSKRNRTNSINGVGFSNKFARSQLPQNAFSSISATLRGGEDQHRNYKFEAKKRGMSDVDETNVRQLQDNTSTMIQFQLTRMIS